MEYMILQEARHREGEDRIEEINSYADRPSQVSNWKCIFEKKRERRKTEGTVA